MEMDMECPGEMHCLRRADKDVGARRGFGEGG